MVQVGDVSIGSGKPNYTCAEAIPYAGRALCSRTSAWAALAQKRKETGTKR